MTERPPEDLGDLLAETHDHLTAIAELPVDPAASPWLGEAEAVVGDVARGDAPPGAIATRVDQARELLASVESTDHPEADQHLERVRELLETIAALLREDR